MKYLYVIPCRKGSKGIPDKNWQLLGDKELFKISFEQALRCKRPNDGLIVSTDDLKIRNYVNKFGNFAPFIRPQELCSDNAPNQDVLIHAYQYDGRCWDGVIMMQPTSPFRKDTDVVESIAKFERTGCKLLMSAVECLSNPYFILYEYNNEKKLEKSKPGYFSCRQECPKVYEINGAIFIYKPNVLCEERLGSIDNLELHLMNEFDSIDIDRPIDLEFARYVNNKNT